jgi:hypothetical protein
LPASMKLGVNPVGKLQGSIVGLEVGSMFCASEGFMVFASSDWASAAVDL